MRDDRGVALIDMIVAVALGFIMAGMVVPVVGGTLERERALVGSRYLAGQLQRARLESLRRGQSVAVRFEIVGDRTQLRLYADANGNGVLQKDIDKGLDLPLAPAEWLDDQARDFSLRVNQTIKDVSGTATIAAGDDPMRIGSSALLTFSPTGSATGGTLYVAAHTGPQMAVRIFGATGRVRVLMFDAQSRQWQP